MSLTQSSITESNCESNRVHLCVLWLVLKNNQQYKNLGRCLLWLQENGKIDIILGNNILVDCEESVVKLS